MIGNHVSGNLYNKGFSESSKEKCTAFQSMDWSLIVHKNLRHYSPSLSLSLSLFVFFISKYSEKCCKTHKKTLLPESLF